MANINSSYKRFVCVSCSHGHFADPVALKQVLKFAARFKPHTRIHLGDFTDQAAFRAGARGTNDEGVSIEADLKHGLSFLKEYRPNILLNGNHEIRLYKAADSNNALAVRAACSVISEIRDLTDKMKCQWIEHYDITRSWVTLGDTKFAHGWMYSEAAIRDHAEHFGKVVIGHVHRPGSEPGRRADKDVVGYCAGMLADRDKLTYAHTRRATARWALGFVYGYYSDAFCDVNMSRCACGDAADWRLPL